MLTTLALYQSSLRWFEACSCKPTPRGLPSSLMFLRGAPTNACPSVILEAEDYDLKARIHAPTTAC